MNTQDTAMMERPAFVLPDVAAGTEFSQEELAQDMDGLQIGFRNVKIPSGGQIQFELPGEDPDNPDYTKFLDGVIVHSHNANAYWATGINEDENPSPDCQSMDGKLGYGSPGGICADCPYNRYGTDPNPNGTGRGKACKNQRIVYLLRSGEALPIQLSLSPTSIRPYTDFINAAFLARRRGVCGSVVRIGLRKANNGKNELAKIRSYAASFKDQVDLILSQRAESAETEASSGVVMERPARVMPSNEGHFEVGAEINGGRNTLPM